MFILTERHTRAVDVTLYKTFSTIFYGIAKPLVASKHCNAVVIGIIPLVVIIDLHTAVGLQIRFINNIKPQSVAKLIKHRGVRIM